jgi:hypothetical protein
MPEGRAERAVEAPAKSIDGAERSGSMKGVMAGAQIDGQDRPHVLAQMAAEVGREHRSDQTAECDSDRRADRRHTWRGSRRHCRATHTFQRRASHGVNDPTGQARGHPALATPGSFTPRLADQSPTPWRSDGRQSAPPDRRDAADNCMCGFMIGDRDALGGQTLDVGEHVRSPQ